MDHTRDVAFAASPAFVWDAARINLPDGKTFAGDVGVSDRGVGKDKWDRSTEYLKGAVEHFSQVVSVSVAGGDQPRRPRAGMEYPGIVFDGMDDAGSKLFWITAHEIGHSWFPMIVGSNERRHAFMDEGFNTFIDIYASDAFNGGEYAAQARFGIRAEGRQSGRRDPAAAGRCRRADAARHGRCHQREVPASVHLLQGRAGTGAAARTDPRAGALRPGVPPIHRRPGRTSIRRPRTSSA